MTSRRNLILASLAAVAAGGAGARAQSFPSQPVKVVVPFPPGGGTDALARAIQEPMQKVLGQTVIIDNKGGAGGTLGAGVAARAAPDGYTYFMGAVHHAIAPSMYPKLDYNIETDFVPVGLISSVPQVIVVNPQKVSAKTLPELLDLLRKNPGKLNYGSAGNGTSHHLAGELFKLQTQTFITHIPYRGAGPALQDLIAGQVDMMFDGLGSSANHIKGGRIRAIAVAAGKPAPGFPEVPLAKSGGAPNYEVATWYGLWAPKGTPNDIITKLNAAAVEALADPALRQRLNGMGFDIAPREQQTPKALAVHHKAEVAKWSAIIKAADVKPE
jgi:tripartite-type tricarboxylate transporter receptor subunit TctC